MRRSATGILLALLPLWLGCSGTPERFPGIPTDKQPSRGAEGLRYIDLVEGTGDMARQGADVTVHYSGYLRDSTKFDSSFDRGEPLTFRLGVGMVIRGWDEGIRTMKVGGKRKLIIPPHLAYGDRGIPGSIPPSSELVFDVELLSQK
jgi:peptidylprolyl isomerase